MVYLEEQSTMLNVYLLVYNNNTYHPLIIPIYKDMIISKDIGGSLWYMKLENEFGIFDR